MYFGWWNQGGADVGTIFNRSISAGNVDNTVVAQTQGGGTNPDRPWLVVNTASLYLSFSNTGFLPYVKRAAMPSGTGTISWSTGAVQVASPATGTTFVSSFPMATHVDGSGNEAVWLLARQYKPPPVATLTQNVVRIWKSTDAGATWSSDLLGINVDSADGYVEDRDVWMVPYHLAKDPAPSSGKLYAFYVRNETSFSLTYPTRNVLYCRTSTNGGATWNGEVRVFTLDANDYPSAGFGTVPINTFNSTSGFFRIGRVWGTVDPSGNVYVAWMDNRYGKFSNEKDYWHVFYSKSTNSGETWSAPVRVSGTTNATASASIGGGAPRAFAWVPPGDFLTCYSDGVNLYVAWPDNRADQSTGGTHVYVKAIAQ